jgi:Mg2+ and Co2+ transporter CorA
MTKSVRLVPPEQTAEETPANAIDKVRDLLFGEVKREHDDRIAELDLSLKSMSDRIAEQFKAMEAKMEAISQALSSRHDESLRQIGEAMVSVGRQISSLGSAREHDRDGKA